MASNSDSLDNYLCLNREDNSCVDIEEVNPSIGKFEKVEYEPSVTEIENRQQENDTLGEQIRHVQRQIQELSDTPIPKPNCDIGSTGHPKSEEKKDQLEPEEELRIETIEETLRRIEKLADVSNFDPPKPTTSPIRPTIHDNKNDKHGCANSLSKLESDPSERGIDTFSARIKESCPNTSASDTTEDTAVLNTDNAKSDFTNKVSTESHVKAASAISSPDSTKELKTEDDTRINETPSASTYKKLEELVENIEKPCEGSSPESTTNSLENIENESLQEMETKSDLAIDHLQIETSPLSADVIFKETEALDEGEINEEKLKQPSEETTEHLESMEKNDLPSPACKEQTQVSTEPTDKSLEISEESTSISVNEGQLIEKDINDAVPSLDSGTNDKPSTNEILKESNESPTNPEHDDRLEEKDKPSAMSTSHVGSPDELSSNQTSKENKELKESNESPSKHANEESNELTLKHGKEESKETVSKHVNEESKTTLKHANEESKSTSKHANEEINNESTLKHSNEDNKSTLKHANEDNNESTLKHANEENNESILKHANEESKSTLTLKHANEESKESASKHANDENKSTTKHADKEGKESTLKHANDESNESQLKQANEESKKSTIKHANQESKESTLKHENEDPIKDTDTSLDTVSSCHPGSQDELSKTEEKLEDGEDVLIVTVAPDQTISTSEVLPIFSSSDLVTTEAETSTLDSEPIARGTSQDSADSDDDMFSKCRTFKGVKIHGLTKKHMCAECTYPMRNPDHYLYYGNECRVSNCRFATTCKTRYMQHFQLFHTTDVRTQPHERDLDQPWYCHCGFSTLRGNKLAEHLVVCSKLKAYCKPSEAPLEIQISNVRHVKKQFEEKNKTKKNKKPAEKEKSTPTVSSDSKNKAKKKPPKSTVLLSSDSSSEEEKDKLDFRKKVEDTRKQIALLQKQHAERQALEEKLRVKNAAKELEKEEKDRKRREKKLKRKQEEMRSDRSMVSSSDEKHKERDNKTSSNKSGDGNSSKQVVVKREEPKQPSDDKVVIKQEPREPSEIRIKQEPPDDPEAGNCSIEAPAFSDEEEADQILNKKIKLESGIEPEETSSGFQGDISAIIKSLGSDDESGDDKQSKTDVFTPLRTVSIPEPTTAIDRSQKTSSSLEKTTSKEKSVMDDSNTPKTVSKSNAELSKQTKKLTGWIMYKGFKIRREDRRKLRYRVMRLKLHKCDYLVKKIKQQVPINWKEYFKREQMRSEKRHKRNQRSLSRVLSLESDRSSSIREEQVTKERPVKREHSVEKTLAKTVVKEEKAESSTVPGLDDSSAQSSTSTKEEKVEPSVKAERLDTSATNDRDKTTESVAKDSDSNKVVSEQEDSTSDKQDDVKKSEAVKSETMSKEQKKSVVVKQEAAKKSRQDETKKHQSFKFDEMKKRIAEKRAQAEKQLSSERPRDDKKTFKIPKRKIITSQSKDILGDLLENMRKEQGARTENANKEPNKDTGKRPVGKVLPFSSTSNDKVRAKYPATGTVANSTVQSKYPPIGNSPNSQPKYPSIGSSPIVQPKYPPIGNSPTVNPKYQAQNTSASSKYTNSTAPLKGKEMPQNTVQRRPGDSKYNAYKQSDKSSRQDSIEEDSFDAVSPIDDDDDSFVVMNSSNKDSTHTNSSDAQAAIPPSNSEATDDPPRPISAPEEDDLVVIPDDIPLEDDWSEFDHVMSPAVTRLADAIKKPTPPTKALLPTPPPKLTPELFVRAYMENYNLRTVTICPFEQKDLGNKTLRTWLAKALEFFVRKSNSGKSVAVLHYGSAEIGDSAFHDIRREFVSSRVTQLPVKHAVVDFDVNECQNHANVNQMIQPPEAGSDWYRFVLVDGVPDLLTTDDLLLIFPESRQAIDFRSPGCKGNVVLEFPSSVQADSCVLNNHSDTIGRLLYRQTLSGPSHSY